MKLLFISTLLFLSLKISAQSVSINSDGSAPDQSAVLDVKSLNKGLLVPKLSTEQMLAIPTPAEGLIIYRP
jgi:hypothetical protein